jgi:hypothetical protein
MLRMGALGIGVCCSMLSRRSRRSLCSKCWNLAELRFSMSPRSLLARDTRRGRYAVWLGLFFYGDLPSSSKDNAMVQGASENMQFCFPSSMYPLNAAAKASGTSADGSPISSIHCRHKSSHQAGVRCILPCLQYTPQHAPGQYARLINFCPALLHKLTHFLKTCPWP